eukprot:m.166263 g.166263  ORF g.166263 m.166263 type:complete len:567 (-) comp15275_c0_seq3:50-1750(-)
MHLRQYDRSALLLLIQFFLCIQKIGGDTSAVSADKLPKAEPSLSQQVINSGDATLNKKRRHANHPRRSKIRTLTVFSFRMQKLEPAPASREIVLTGGIYSEKDGSLAFVVADYRMNKEWENATRVMHVLPESYKCTYSTSPSLDDNEPVISTQLQLLHFPATPSEDLSKMPFWEEQHTAENRQARHKLAVDYNMSSSWYIPPSSLVWSCALPAGFNSTWRQAVQLQGPDKADIVYGDGVFPIILRRRKAATVGSPETVSLAACQAPLYRWSNIINEFYQNIEFKLFTGVEHIFFYAIKNSNRMMADGIPILSQYIREGLGSLTLIPGDIEHLLDPRQMEHLILSDCLWRTRGCFDWVMLQHDLDEYLLKLPLQDMSTVQTSLKLLLGNTLALDQVASVRSLHRVLKPRTRVQEKIVESNIKDLSKEASAISRARFKMYSNLSQYMDLGTFEGLRELETFSSKGYSSKFGKIIVRPELVNTAWVHGASNIEPGYSEAIISDVAESTLVAIWGWWALVHDSTVKWNQLYGNRSVRSTVPVSFKPLNEELMRRIKKRTFESIFGKKKPK